MGKTCNTCSRYLDDCSFNRCGGPVGTLSTMCKICNRTYQKQYNATASGRAVKMWSAIQGRCGDPRGKNPAYRNVGCAFTRDDFLKWAVPAIELFMRENPGQVVSIDRINVLKGYELGNVQIISYRDNSLKALKKFARQVGAKDGDSHLRNKKLATNPTISALAPLPRSTVTPPPAPRGYQQISSLGWM